LHFNFYILQFGFVNSK